ncbi:hypothetical protein [Lysobacter terrae]
MTAQGSSAPLQVKFNRRPSQLRVHVTGDSTLENTVAYWQAIVAEVERERVASLLLIDELSGRPLLQAEWLSLVQHMAGHGLEDMRIAHVKPQGLQQIEYCEIFARDAGFNARVFDDEHAADLWLRYGET